MKSHILQKIAEPAALKQMLARWRLINQRIVFTNGCFDLIHPGHIEYLLEARSLGNRLVVGINSDDSVRRLKGFGRPIKDDYTRTLVMASFEFVDAVVLFEEDTPLKLIEVIRPDVLVKGGDWPEDQIVGAAVVRSYGGLVKSLPFIEGYSTTALEKKIIDNYRRE